MELTPSKQKKVMEGICTSQFSLEGQAYMAKWGRTPEQISNLFPSDIFFVTVGLNEHGA